MFTKLKKMFSDPTNAPQDWLVQPNKLALVEVQAAERPQPASPEIRESVLSLQFHPGFQYLMKKLGFQRSVIDARLRTERHTELKDVYLLQSMINGFNWLETQIEQEVQANKLSQRVPATPYEEQLFKQVSSAIERLE